MEGEAEMIGLKYWVGFCLSLSETYRDYPFGEEWTVLRHKGSKKSFALFYQGGAGLCVNLKCDPLRADFLRRVYPWVTPGYHMNKTHWNTVLLDRADEDEVRSMILHSYLLTAGFQKAAGERGKKQ